MPKIVAEVLTENIPYEEITEVMHKAYAQHKAEGLNYAAIDQDWTETKARIDKGGCVVAKCEGKIVGVIVYQVKEKGDKWYMRGDYIAISQFAILPEYRGMSIPMSFYKVYKAESEKNSSIKQFIFDTAVDAHELVEGYTKLGAQIVDMVSWPNTNYYSYIFSLALDRKNFPEELVAKKLKEAELKCKLQYNKDGSRTVIGKVWNMLQ